MSVKARSAQQPPVEEMLEDRIFRRLQEWQEKHPNGNGSRDLELESDIYHFLYRELRSVATILPGFGKQTINKRADVSCRFTSVLNKAFLRIIEKYPDKLMQAKSRKQLTGYVSRTMSNMMLSHYKRKGDFRRIVEKLGLTDIEDAQVRDILCHLADEKAEYFEQRTGVSFSRGLELIRQWDESTDPDQNARAVVLRLRYVDGLSYNDIASEMKTDRSNVENVLEQAKYHLRKLQS